MLRGECDVSEWSLRCKDGSYLPVEVSAKILSDGRWQGFVRDVRERRAAEKALRASEQRLRFAAEVARFGTFDVSFVNGSSYLSPEFSKLFGLPPDFAMVAPARPGWFLEYVHPRDRERVRAKLADCTRMGRDFHDEHRIVMPNGDIRWVLVDARLFYGEDVSSGPLRSVGTVIDVTERKSIEETIRASEAKYAGLIAAAPDAIISIDRDQRIVMYNEGAEKTFGWKRTEIIGQLLDVLIPERLRAVHRKHIVRFDEEFSKSRLMGERSDISGLRRDGTEFPAEASISKVETASGKLFTVVLRDITARKRAEEERALLAEIGAAVTSTLDYEETACNIATVVVGALADLCIVETVEEEGTLRRVKVAHRDPSMAEVACVLQHLQLDRRQPHLGSAALDTKKPLVMSEISTAYLDSITQSEAHGRALRALAPTSLMSLPLLAHGQLEGALILVRTRGAKPYTRDDLSMGEKVALRAALAVENARLYRTAQRAVLARDEVLGIVAHDLRNPLNSIVLQSEMLRKRAPQPDRRSQKPAELIRRSAMRMERLIQDLLDIVRLEAGTFSVNRTPLSSYAIVMEAVEAQRPVAAACGRELVLDVPALLPQIVGDHDRLLQVFDNLIGNAMKFTTSGGRITVGATARNGDVLFWVSDTGAGIPAESIPHLFDRFWQARPTDRRGAGLGLPIVRAIVEAHGGRVWVESALGSGSTFYFALPAAASKAA
ncbi:MAG: PAS domain S-box protein [Polyangiaceae bacterium]|nr:PAS domain S-box protein [Polyangiaceae bacterium]